MKQSNILSFFVAGAFLFFSPQVHAAEYWASPNGGGNGSQNSPWSVDQANNNAQAGDTVNFLAGSYTQALEPKNSGTNGKWIIFRGAPGTNITTNAPIFQGKTININAKNYIRIEGLRVNNAPTGISIKGKCDHITISGNYIYASNHSSIEAWGTRWQTNGGDYKIITNLIVEKNEIEKSHVGGGHNEQITFAMGVYGFEIRDNHLFNGGSRENGGEGIDIKEGVRNGKIYRNHIEGIQRNAIYLDGGRNGGWRGGHGVGQKFGGDETPGIVNVDVFENYIHDSENTGIGAVTEGVGKVKNIRIYNNVIARMSGIGIVVYRHPDGYGYTGDILIANNTIYKNGRDGIHLNHPKGTNITIKNNLVWGNAKQDFRNMSIGPGLVEENNIWGGNPGVVNADALDFNLTAGSPAIDKADPSASPNRDFYRGRRPNGNMPDIGAIEFGSTKGPMLNHTGYPGNTKYPGDLGGAEGEVRAPLAGADGEKNEDAGNTNLVNEGTGDNTPVNEETGTDGETPLPVTPEIPGNIPGKTGTLCNAFSSTGQWPNWAQKLNFGPPFSGNPAKTILNINCHIGNAIATLSIFVNNTERIYHTYTTGYIYMKSHVSACQERNREKAEGEKELCWKKILFTGNVMPNTENKWIESNAKLTTAILESDLREEGYIAAFLCAWNTKIEDWDCGCDTDQCGSESLHWTLQGFKVGGVQEGLDVQDPTAPGKPVILSISGTQAGISWEESDDNIEVAGYRVYRDGQLQGVSKTGSFLDTKLAPETGYQYEIEAFDTAGNTSQKRAQVKIHTTNVTEEEDINISSTVPELTVAFLAENGISENAKSVLRLLKKESADLAFIQGGLGMEKTPDEWMNQVDAILGNDFPLIATPGNADAQEWNQYQDIFQKRSKNIPELTCDGEYGIMSSCTYKGLKTVSLAPHIRIPGKTEKTENQFSQYIHEELASDKSLWSICTWSKNMSALQVGNKQDETGWKVYESCLSEGAIIATGHNRSYARTHGMTNFEKQVIGDRTSPVDLERGKSLVFVSGLGGAGVHEQKKQEDWWAKYFTKDQDAIAGALFCTFHANQDPRRAKCVFKDIEGKEQDSFEITRK